ncbi:Na+/H+ antiporter family protein, partial [Haemophilus influenzae]
KQLI